MGTFLHTIVLSVIFLWKIVWTVVLVSIYIIHIVPWFHVNSFTLTKKTLQSNGTISKVIIYRTLHHWTRTFLLSLMMFYKVRPRGQHTTSKLLPFFNMHLNNNCIIRSKSISTSNNLSKYTACAFVTFTF